MEHVGPEQIHSCVGERVLLLFHPWACLAVQPRHQALKKEQNLAPVPVLDDMSCRQETRGPLYGDLPVR